MPSSVQLHYWGCSELAGTTGETPPALSLSTTILKSIYIQQRPGLLKLKPEAKPLSTTACATTAACRKRAVRQCRELEYELFTLTNNHSRINELSK